MKRIDYPMVPPLHQLVRLDWSEVRLKIL